METKRRSTTNFNTTSSPISTATGGSSAPVFKKDREGQLVGPRGDNPIDPTTPSEWTKACPPERYPPRNAACSASTATSSRTPTAMGSFTARSGTRWRSPTSIATAPTTNAPMLRSSGPAAPSGADGGTNFASSWVGVGRDRKMLRAARRSVDPALSDELESRMERRADDRHDQPRQRVGDEDPDGAQGVAGTPRLDRVDGKTWGDFPEAEESLCLGSRVSG